MTPLVSVIIPLYNRQSTIQACITSILEQTFQDFEIIVVDDGSSDSSIEMVREIKDERLRLYCNFNNSGAQAARNRGISESMGDWIAFLDSDDKYLPHSLSSRLDVATSQGVGVVHSDCLVEKKKTKKAKLLGIPPWQNNIYEQILRRPGPVYQALFVRKECLINIGFLDEKIKAFQEWDTMIRLAKNNRFGYVFQPTFIYNRTGNDTISGNLHNEAQGYLQIVTKHQSEILRVCGKNAMSTHYWRIARYSLAAGNRSLARGYYHTAWKWSRMNWRLWAYVPIIFFGKKCQDIIYKIFDKA
jgi:glycosyltransferase involved in cell wall biosynthesis